MAVGAGMVAIASVATVTHLVVALVYPVVLKRVPGRLGADAAQRQLRRSPRRAARSAHRIDASRRNRLRAQRDREATDGERVVSLSSSAGSTNAVSLSTHSPISTACSPFAPVRPTRTIDLRERVSESGFGDDVYRGFFRG